MSRKEPAPGIDYAACTFGRRAQRILQLPKAETGFLKGNSAAGSDGTPPGTQRRHVLEKAPEAFFVFDCAWERRGEYSKAYAQLYIYIYIYIYIYTHIHTYTHTHTLTHKYVCIYTHGARGADIGKEKKERKRSYVSEEAIIVLMV